LSNKPKRLF